MHVELMQPSELGASLRATWEAMCERERSLASPFFSTHFVDAVARVRPVEVAVIELNGKVAAFLAFHRERLRTGVPVGAPICDHHGLVIEPGVDLNGAELLKQCRLSRLRFWALPAEQRAFSQFHTRTEDSPIVNLARMQPSDQGRKLRRLEREVGPVRFELHCVDPNVLDTLIAWKRAQFVRTGYPDIFCEDWARSLLHELHRTQAPSLRGWLSVLWAGSAPVAAHFGLASQRAWHWWYPAYDAAFSRHSPGLLMLHEMLKLGPSLGIEWLDFGWGKEDFKWQLANDVVKVARGTAYTRFGRLAFEARARLQATGAYPRLVGPLRRGYGWVNGLKAK